MTPALAHARWELRLLLSNGEQVLLALVIPTALVFLLRDAAPVACASVIATMFTSLAIATGFERRSGALRYLGVTPLTRTSLLVGKLLAQGAVLVLSLVLAGIAAAILGVLPALGGRGLLVWILGIALAMWAFAAWALVIAGTIRAEATLAVANALFLVLVATAAADPASLASPWRQVLFTLPSGALSHVLRYPDEAMPALAAFAVLALWAVIGTAVAARRFRWE